MAFAIEAEPDGTHVVLAVRGEVDIATAPELRERLAETVVAYDAVVVDLERVPFMDSTGLGVLVAAQRRAAAAGHAVVLARPQRIVRNALHLIQLDAAIGVYESVADALASV